MWTLLKEQWTDSAKFTATLRGLVALLGGAIAAGYITIPGIHPGIGMLILGGSQTIAAGQKNET